MRDARIAMLKYSRLFLTIIEHYDYQGIGESSFRKFICLNVFRIIKQMDANPKLDLALSNPNANESYSNTYIHRWCRIRSIVIYYTSHDKYRTSYNESNLS
jgi:hypothetical protein